MLQHHRIHATMRMQQGDVRGMCVRLASDCKTNVRQTVSNSSVSDGICSDVVQGGRCTFPFFAWRRLGNDMFMKHRIPHTKKHGNDFA